MLQVTIYNAIWALTIEVMPTAIFALGTATFVAAIVAIMFGIVPANRRN